MPRKKGFLEKLFTSSSKKGEGSWRVILKGVPDKQVEANLISLLTERLNASAKDAAKIVQAAPLILFSNLTSHEAEQIKLRLNETGVRTAISNDPEELKGLATVSWPKKVVPEDLTGVASDLPAPPPFLPSVSQPPSAPKPAFPVMPSLPKAASLPPKPELPAKEKPALPRPVIPPRPSTPLPSVPPLPTASLPSPPPAPSPLPPLRPLSPLPPSPPAEDWKLKYDQLQRSHAEALSQMENKYAQLQRSHAESLSKLEKREMEINDLQDHLKELIEQAETRDKQSREAIQDRHHFKTQTDALQQELKALKERLEVFEKEREEAREALRVEMQQNASARDSLERVIAMLHSEKQNLQGEVSALLRGIKSDLEFRITELMRPIEPLKAHLKRIELLLEAFDRPDVPEERTKSRPSKTPPFNRPPSASP